MSKDVSKLHGFLNSETVLTIATADACGAWSAPVLYVADTQAEPFELYFLSSSNSRHISGLPLSGSAAVSIYTEYTGAWQSIRGVQIHASITQVAESEKASIAQRYFERFPEVKALIDRPAS